jgi:hypothetical protein
MTASLARPPVVMATPQDILEVQTSGCAKTLYERRILIPREYGKFCRSAPTRNRVPSAVQTTVGSETAQYRP